MDPKDVLKYYVDRCNARADYFEFSLASNAVMDWFGRTFRSSKNIEQYLRCDVWPQYDQNFTAAVVCEPIENKPAHMQTRDVPIENANVCSVPVVCKSDEFDSPPNSNLIVKSDKPPPLTRGKRFLKTFADDQSAPPKTKTYNLRRFNEDAHKRSSPAKCDTKHSRKRAAKTTTDNSEDASPTKRSKSTEIVTSGSTPTKLSNQTLDSAYKQSDTTNNASRSKTVTCSNQKTYTDLKYLESIGSIRTIRRVKHPGINKVPSVKTDVVTPFISPESQNGWDRKTKLKLSYRLNTSDINDIQFALIIYEPLTMVTRRNLLEEFEKAARDEANHTQSTNKIKSSTKLKIHNKPRNDKLSSLRRLRF